MADTYYSNHSLCIRYLSVDLNHKSATRVYDFPTKVKGSLDSIDPIREMKKFVTYLMSRSTVKYDDCRYPILGFYSDMSQDYRDMVAYFLGLEHYKSDPYVVPTIFNMVHLTGWDPEKAREYLSLVSPDISESDKYQGLLQYVLGYCDKYYDTQDQKTKKFYDWLCTQNMSTVFDIYTAFVSCAKTPDSGVIYPGHILFQILEYVDPLDLLFIHFKTVISNTTALHLTYRQFGIDHNTTSQYCAYNQMLRNYKKYEGMIASFYTHKSPVNPIKYRVLVICFNNRHTDMNDTSNGVANLTKGLMLKLGINPLETMFDSISRAYVRIDNEFTYLDNNEMFPSDKAINLLEIQQIKYDLVIFERCPQVESMIVSPRVAKVLCDAMKFTAVLVVTKTEDTTVYEKVLSEHFRKVEYQDLELKMVDREIIRENFAACNGKRCKNIIKPVGIEKMNYYLPL